MYFCTPQGRTSAKADAEWMAFLLWLGWWISDVALAGTRLYCVLLVPSRSCCAAITALGTLIRSAQQGGSEYYSWDEFSSLRPGSKFYVLHRALRTESSRSCPAEIIEPRDSAAVWYVVHHRRGRFTIGTTRSKYFYAKQARRSPHPQGIRMQRLNRNGLFYQAIVDQLDPGWALSPVEECQIVTARVKWARELAGLGVEVKDGANHDLRFELSDALMYRERSQAGAARVILSSSGSNDLGGTKCGVTILDGPDAFQDLGCVSSDRLLILLEHQEYDVSISNELALLVSKRDDSILSKSEIPGYSLPPAMRVTVFAVNKDLL